MRVPQDHRTPGADQVDILAAVDVGEVRARGAGHEPRRSADGPEGAHGAVDPARGDRSGAVEKGGEEGASYGYGGRGRGVIRALSQASLRARSGVASGVERVRPRRELRPAPRLRRGSSRVDVSRASRARPRHTPRHDRLVDAEGRVTHLAHGRAESHELLRARGSSRCAERCATWVGASLTDLRPASVSTSSTPRRSDRQASRRTHPRFSRRPAVWVSRLRDCTTSSAIVDIRSRRSGASERTADDLVLGQLQPVGLEVAIHRRLEQPARAQVGRQACCSAVISHRGSCQSAYSPWIPPLPSQSSVQRFSRPGHSVRALSCMPAGPRSERLSAGLECGRCLTPGVDKRPRSERADPERGGSLTTGPSAPPEGRAPAQVVVEVDPSTATRSIPSPSKASISESRPTPRRPGVTSPRSRSPPRGR